MSARSIVRAMHFAFTGNSQSLVTAAKAAQDAITALRKAATIRTPGASRTAGKKIAEEIAEEIGKSKPSGMFADYIQGLRATTKTSAQLWRTAGDERVAIERRVQQRVSQDALIALRERTKVQLKQFSKVRAAQFESAKASTGQPGLASSFMNVMGLAPKTSGMSLMATAMGTGGGTGGGRGGRGGRKPPGLSIIDAMRTKPVAEAEKLASSFMNVMGLAPKTSGMSLMATAMGTGGGTGGGRGGRGGRKPPSGPGLSIIDAMRTKPVAPHIAEAEKLAGAYGMTDTVAKLLSGNTQNLAKNLREVSSSMRSNVSAGTMTVEQGKQLTQAIKSSWDAQAQLNPKMAEGAAVVGRWTERTGEAAAAAGKQKGSLVELAGAYNALVVAKHAVVALSKLIVPAMEMETALSNLSVTTGLSAENISKVGAAARDAAQYVNFTPTEAIETAKHLNLAVRDTGATIAALRPTLMMAQAYMGGSVPKATALVTKTMGAFNLSATELEPTLNKLIAGARAVGVEADTLEGGIGKLGVAASRLGSNFDDIYPAFLMAVKGGLSAQEASTGLKTALGRLADPKIRSQLSASLGVLVETDGRFNSVRGTMLALAEAANTSGLSQVEYAQAIGKAFGDRAIKPIMVNIKKLNEGILDQNGNVLKGAAAYDSIQGAMQNSSGLLQSTSEEAMKPLSAQLERMREAFTNLADTVFTPLLAVLTPTVEVISWLTNGIRALFTDLGPLSSILKTVTSAMLSGLGVTLALVAGILAAGGVARILTTAVAFLGTAVGPVLTANLRMSTSGLGTWAASAYAAMKAGEGFGVAVKGIGGVLIGLAGKFAGFLLILAVLREVYDLFMQYSDLGFTQHAAKVSAKYQADIQRQFYSATTAQINAVTANVQSMMGLKKTAETLESVLASMAAAEKSKVAVLSMGTVTKMEGRLAKYGASGEMTPDDVGRVGYQLWQVKSVMQDIQAGLTPDVDRMKAAGAAMKLLNAGFKGAAPLDVKFAKELDGLNAAMQDSINGASQWAGKGRQFMGMAGRGTAPMEKLQERADLATSRLAIASGRGVRIDAQTLAIDQQLAQLVKLRALWKESSGMPGIGDASTGTVFMSKVRRMGLPPDAMRAFEDSMAQQVDKWGKWELPKSLQGVFTDHGPLPLPQLLGFGKTESADFEKALGAAQDTLQKHKQDLLTSGKNLVATLPGLDVFAQKMYNVLGLGGAGPNALPTFGAVSYAPKSTVPTGSEGGSSVAGIAANTAETAAAVKSLRDNGIRVRDQVQNFFSFVVDGEAIDLLAAKVVKTIRGGGGTSFGDDEK